RMAGRVGVEYGLAAVKLLEHRRKERIAEEFVVVIGPKIDAVGLERVEGVFDLPERAVNVGKRKIGEIAEASGMIGAQPRGKLVGEARELPCLGMVAQLEIRNRDRGHRERNSAPVHVLDLTRDGGA